MIDIKFEGVDSWSRLVYKDINSNKRYGSLFVLAGSSVKETQKIVKDIDPKGLVYFGTHFDCEPEGNKPTEELRII